MTREERQRQVQEILNTEIKKRGKTKHEIMDKAASISAEIITGKGKWGELDTETRIIISLESTMLFSDLIDQLFKEDNQ